MTVAPDPVLHVQVPPGLIEYTDAQGKPQKFYFQANPTSLSRSRSFERVDTQATNNAAGTKTPRGAAGRKFTHRSHTWRLESIELAFDASMPHWMTGKRSDEDGLAAVQDGLRHLEAISEPGPVPSENESQTGAPPQPSPPLVTFTLGKRSWQGHISSLSILEKDFTPDLVPRQVKATLSLDVIVTESQLEQGKTGGKQ